MPDERRYYVHSDDNCKFESMTKEQILAAIVQAVEGHSISDVDTGFVQVLKEQNHGAGLKFWIGSTAEYNALQSIDQDCFYILTDDTELDDMEADIESFRAELTDMGTTVSNLSDAVESQAQEISNVGVIAISNSDSVFDSDTRKSLVLLNGVWIPYGDDLNYTLDFYSGFLPHHSHPAEPYTLTIADLKQVRVTPRIAPLCEVTCTVTVDRTNNQIHIRGVSPHGAQIYEGGTGTTSFVIVEMTCENTAGNTYRIISNKTCHYSVDVDGTPSWMKLQVEKIVGVM